MKCFKGFRGVTQGEPLSPTIFNMVMDVLVWHWVEDMAESAGGQGGCRREVIHKNTPFYANDGMIEPSEPGWLQGASITLLGMFERVGLRTNVRKKVRMVCRPCQTAGTQLEAAYKQTMTSAGLSY